MPTWSEVLHELEATARLDPAGLPYLDFDSIRTKYLQQLHSLTGRAVIVYASGWLHHAGQSDPSTAVHGTDVHALMEVCHGVRARELDLILHSPGGSPAAAEQMLNYLRTQFDDIRAIIPLQAKSAATMIALGCDEIVMGKHSELGPIDPQIGISVPGGARFAPAYAILRDFERAKEEIAKDVTVLPAWTPILHSYGGGLLDVCTQQIALAKDVVEGWLQRYMLTHDDVAIPLEQRVSVAKQIVNDFSSKESYERWKIHGRPIRVEELLDKPGLRIRRLEDDQALQDAVLSLYHGFDLFLGARPVSKITENHIQRRVVRFNRQLLAPNPAAAPKPQPLAPAPSRPPMPPGASQQPQQTARKKRRR